MKYEIIKNDNIDNLCKIINNKLKNGYKLCGGVSVCYINDFKKVMFYQAICKG